MTQPAHKPAPPVSTTPRRPAGPSLWMILLGIIIILLWLTTASLLGAFKLMATLMANDSGSASEASHMHLISGTIIGQLLTALAGIPAGLACFWRSKRKSLLILLALLLTGGLLIQAATFLNFVNTTPT